MRGSSSGVLVTLLGLFLASSMCAQTARPPAVDDDSVASLRREILEARESQLDAALQKLEKASSSPKAAEEFFYDCVRSYDFKRDLEAGSKFDDWKRAFADQWRGHDLGFVLQMQLRHQALVIRSARTEDKATLIPLWVSLIETVVAHVDESMFGASFLAQPVNSSVFDKALKLRQLAGGMEGFGGGPLDLGGIFDQHIHPYVSQENKQAAWEKRIALQSEFADKTLLPTELEDFQNFELPRLRWRQLVDVRFPQNAPVESSALSYAFTFVRQNLKHPDAKFWLEALDDLRKRQETRPQ